MSGLGHDVRYALRIPVVKPLATVVVVLTLGLGIGLDTAEEGEFVLADAVSCNYFSVLGVKPVRGRTFTQQDNAGLATVPVAVVRGSASKRRQGRTASRIGGRDERAGEPDPTYLDR